MLRLWIGIGLITEVVSSLASVARAEDVLILVAASANDAVKEIAGEFEKETTTTVKISAGPSQALANQIIQGAPAHLFISANEEWAKKVDEEGQAAKTVRLLTNDLVLVVPKGNPARVKSPSDLRSDAVERIALAGEKVPAGKYAQQALTSLKLYDSLLGAKKIVCGQDVRATLVLVERGEADAGIVYSTDARVTDKIEVVHKFDPKTFDKIVYPLVLLKEGRDHADAVKFFDFLQSKAAARIFDKHGFARLEK
jgi:molybdate transport system substrate-binding protein